MGDEAQKGAQRSAVDEFRDTLVNALANEMQMLRAPRDQWEIVANGVIDKMHVRGVPTTVMFSATTLAGQCVVFDIQGQQPIPEVPTVGPTVSVEDQTPIVTVDDVEGTDG